MWRSYLEAVPVLFAHPFVIAAFAALMAYLFAEKWQRWRQRRDFQYRATTTLSSASATVLKVLYETWGMHDGGYDREHHQELRREYRVQMMPLLSLDADFFATFEDESLQADLGHLTGVLNAAHKELFKAGRLGSLDQPQKDRARAILKCATAQRRLMIAKMSREMELVRPTDDLLRKLERRAHDLPDGVTIPPLEDA